ncbi:MAG TPA: nucleotidyltransferase family protein [Candidatus Paceibacterota bacterium]|nr:nucleotidyltransferase family protein [Verrucomicrobiota bacterium]HOX03710.1 nucleotidyltransferase family protein [Verrucomicrobiota bacterium]HRZ46397.1 nucleotidyltransferase family protein [Candidatus Paceibacterota bacterium]HRZ92262.1 nucleotidyltransferase family protein [Candidatus Paceibacterota bacterium]
MAAHGTGPVARAVILAAGRGTRMRGMTAELPKPMLRVQGRPILEHIIDGIAAAGIREFCLVTGYRAESIESHFGDGRSRGLRIEYVRQTVQDGTGRAAGLARDFAGADPFLLTYGDILVRPETYRRMLDRKVEGAFDGVLAVTCGADVTKGAIVLFDCDFCLKRLIEKPAPEQIDSLRQEGLLRPGDPAWYNAGIYLLPPAVFERIDGLERSPRGEYELTDAIVGLQAEGRRMAGLEIAGRWVDVRDPEVLAALQRDMADGISPGP